MTGKMLAACVVLVATVAGCSRPLLNQPPNESLVAAAGPFASASFRESWRELLQIEEPGLPAWDWVTAIPQVIPRADLLPADVPRDVVAQHFPESQRATVQLTSTQPLTPLMRIVNVDGHEVRNCADLYDALERIQGKKQVQLDLSNGSGRELAIVADPSTVESLGGWAASDVSAIRAVDDGNPAVIVRNAGLRATVVARVERSRGLLQCVLSIRNVGREPLLAPREVLASCDGEPLSCLSVSETLDRLYNIRTDAPLPPAKKDDARYSFAAGSNQEEFLVPFNYKKLCQQLAEEDIETGSDVLQPAFVSVPDVTYPGPAILADARALTGILLQQQMIGASDGERIGWIVFGGPGLKKGGIVEIQLDLGLGMTTFQFSAPAP